MCLSKIKDNGSDLLALQELRKRKVEGVYQSQWRALNLKLSSVSIKDETHYYQRYQLEMEADHAYGQQEVRVANSSLTEAMESLDRYYLLQRVRASAELLNRQKILGTTADIPFTHHLIAYLEEREAAFEDTQQSICINCCSKPSLNRSLIRPVFN